MSKANYTNLTHEAGAGIANFSKKAFTKCMAKGKKLGYVYGKKKPLWQWLLIYAVIGGVIYAGIYYFLQKSHYIPYGGNQYYWEETQ